MRLDDALTLIKRNEKEGDIVQTADYIVVRDAEGRKFRIAKSKL